jgi:hypothetical protein
MRIALIVTTCLALACSDDGHPLDAGQDDAGSDICDSSHPGVRVHLSFGYVDESSTPYWTWTPGNLQLHTLAGATSYSLAPYELDADHAATVILQYPPGSMAGAANVAFYSTVSTLGNWQADAEFSAAPGACLDVALTVPFVPCCGHEPDAGVSDASM